MRNLAFGLVASCAACFSVAEAAQRSVQTEIIDIGTYTRYDGGGDVLIEVEGALVSECVDGLWIDGTDGVDQALSLLITSQAQGRSVRIYYADDILWPGSGSKKYCRVNSIWNSNGPG